MAKSTTVQVRVSAEEKAALREKAAAGGWRDISDLVRSLVAEQQSAEPLPVIEQSQPGPLDEQPPL